MWSLTSYVAPGEHIFASRGLTIRWPIAIARIENTTKITIVKYRNHGSDSSSALRWLITKSHPALAAKFVSIA
jgi:hypothetical protein